MNLRNRCRMMRRFQRTMHKLLTLLVLVFAGTFFCSDSAHAAFNVFLTPVEDWTSFNPEFAALGDDWISCILGVASDDGSLIGAVDVDLRGVFHQSWNWDDDLDKFTSTPKGISTTGVDSHLLISAAALSAITPLEDSSDFNRNSPLSSRPGAVHYGVGSQLRGAWGVPREASTSQNLAYLVMPRGYESQLEFAIDVASPTGDLFRFRQGASFPALPPDPPVVVPETLPKHLNPLPSVVMPAPAGTPSASPQPPVSPEGPPTPPATAGSNLFPWIAELDSSHDPTLPYGYKAYKFGISTNDGSSIAAIDFRIGHGLLQVV